MKEDEQPDRPLYTQGNERPDLLTVRETAEYLRVNPITVRRHIEAGRLAAARVGKSIRVPREAVERLMAPITALGEEKSPAPVGRLLTREDPLWDLVGFAQDAPATDASRKHEYLADGTSAN